MSVTINKCQIPFLEMLGTYPIAGIYMKLSGIEMSGTYPIAGTYMKLSGIEMSCT